MNPDQPADIAVADQDDRMAMGEDRSQAVENAATQIVEPLKCRRAAPWHEHRRRTVAIVKLAALEGGADRARYGGGLDIVVVERQRRRDYRHVAQWHGVERRDEDRAAGHLYGVLRGADHGGANAC